MTDTQYPRDLSGYGGQPPVADWPDGARIAVQFVINYEEGAENCVLHGDNLRIALQGHCNAENSDRNGLLLKQTIEAPEACTRTGGCRKTVGRN